MEFKAAETQVPCFDFTRDSDFVQGSDGWKTLSKKVREACEEYGCFQVRDDKIPMELYEDMFKVQKELFDLPDETKQKNKNPKPYYGYFGKHDMLPLFESLGIENAITLEATRAFTNLMWPNGNQVFCQTINSMSSKLYDLQLIILKLIMESYRVEKDSVENPDTAFRVMRYNAPKKDSELGLAAHADTSLLTVLCQNSAQGLEVLMKGGDWVSVVPSAGTLTVFVGEALMAWSNGRLHPVKHRVMMGGDKTRYSFALFSTPKEGGVVEAPKELVDDEHPQRFRPFNYMDYLQYFISSNNGDNALEVYAGVQWTKKSE